MKPWTRTVIPALLAGIGLLLALPRASVGQITGPAFLVDAPSSVLIQYTGGPITPSSPLSTVVPPVVSPSGLWTTAPFGLSVSQSEGAFGPFDLLVISPASLSRTDPGATPVTFNLLIGGSGGPFPLSDSLSATVGGDRYTATLAGVPGAAPGSIESWTFTLTGSAVVPEPSSCVLLAAGVLAGLGVWRRRMRAA